jgi:hypothetical protein
MSNVWKRYTRVLSGVVALVVSGSVLPTARAQFVQQGGKLGTGAFQAGQGQSVAISGDGNTAIIGGYNDNSAAGAAWVYTRSGGVWTQQGNKLVGTGATGGARQGYSVAISGDGNTAIVGGETDDGSAGAAWVYTRSGGVWTQQGSKLVGTGATGHAFQGNSVAMSGDGNTAIVGGPADGLIGAAWVYTRSGGVWTQQGSKLVGTGGLVGTGLIANVQEGQSVAISGDGNTTIIGGYNDNSGVGATWVFTRSGGVSTQQGNKLVGTGATGGAPLQGGSLAISGDGNTAIIGGWGDTVNVGATWLFTRISGAWTQQGSKLVGTGAIGGAAQGRSVAISSDGNTAIVGGPLDDKGIGAAWVFVNASTPPSKPAIMGIANDASFTAGGAISTGAWVAIFGTGLAPAGDSRKWNEATEIVNGKLPVSLEGAEPSSSWRKSGSTRRESSGPSPVSPRATGAVPLSPPALPGRGRR